jgi:predicted NBD/HSP70 family sugar kinase
MRGKNQSYLKEENTSIILKLVRSNPGISRAEIVRVSGLTAPTVSRLADFLIQNGIIRERKKKTKNIGRNPIGLYFNEDAFYIIGIDFSYLHVTGALINLSGKIILKQTIYIDSESFSDKNFSEVHDIIRNLIIKAGGKKVLGVGFSSPGMIDHGRGVLIRIPNFHFLQNVPVKDIIEKKFNLPTIVANDANVEAVGEKHFGFGRDVSDFVLLHIGYGIGMGIIIGKKLYAGNFGVSGEIGHTSIDRKNGKKCDCGNRGCVELYAGLMGILSDVSNKLGRKISTVNELKMLVSNGNNETIDILKEKGKLIGYVLVNVINILAPQKIVVTGSVSSIGNSIIAPIKMVVDERSFYGIGKNIPIVLSKLGKNSTLIGAATTVFEQFLEKPYAFLT